VDYRRLNFDRTHLMVINYDWRIPGLRDGNRLVKGVTNGWQVTGITQFISGSPTQAGVGIPNVNLNQRINGSWTEGLGALFTDDISRSSDRNKAFNFEDVRLPTVAEALKLQGRYPAGYMDTPGINVTDLSLFKNFSLGGDGKRSLQLRLEAFNVFNHPQFSGFSSGLNFNICTNFNEQRVTNVNSPALGQLICGPFGGSFLAATPDSLINLRNSTPRPSNNLNSSGQPTLSVSPVTGRIGNSLGEYNGLSGTVSGNRIVQLAVKIYF